MQFKEIGEFGFIDKINIQTILSQKDIIKGIGDDCSVRRLSDGQVLLTTTDMLIDRVHFISQMIDPKDLGYKSLAVNLSDIAAMGGTPLDAYISLAIPAQTQVEYMQSFYEGMRELAMEQNINLMGGDTTSSIQDLVINIVVLGSMPESEVLFRNTAKPGDVIYVTGEIGNSAGGLDLLLNGKTPINDNERHLMGSHFRPYPYIREGRWLAETKRVNAMIDVSDGVASDLGHILKASQVGALIHFNKLPISEELKYYTQKHKRDILKLSLHTGEDYVLLFTSPLVNQKELMMAYHKQFGKSIYPIGEIQKEQEFFLQTNEGRESIHPRGWDHFKEI